MKKTTKKLSLNRETLRQIGAPELTRVFGGAEAAVKYTERYLCTSPAVCVQDTEDSCVIIKR